MHPISVVVPYTRYQYMRYVVRYLKWAAVRPVIPPTQSVRGYLETLTATARPLAKRALRHADIAGVKWTALQTPIAKRNFARLGASILAPGELRRAQEAAEPMERALLTLLYVLRRSEAARATWADVDWSHSIITIPKGKGGRSDRTVMPAVTCAALSAWWSKNGQPTSGGIFLTAYGKAPSAQWVTKQIVALFKRAGINRPYRAPHALRRTFATAYLRANPDDLRGLQQLMRHENVATTVLYTFLQPDDLAERVARAAL